jgi:hypothetical protein
MADINKTPASVEVGLGRVFVNKVTLGEAMSAGEPYYLDSSDSQKAKKGDADTLATSNVQGIILTSGSLDEEVSVATSGPVKLIADADLPGDALTIGSPYFLSTTAGGICDFGTLVTGDYVTLIGFATTTQVIDVAIVRTGIDAVI